MAKVVPISERTRGNDARDDELESDASSSIHSYDNEGEEKESDDKSGDPMLSKQPLKKYKKMKDAQAEKSSFIENRNKLRDQVLKEVMDEIMPDIGAYDIDGMANRVVKSEEGKLSRFLKFVGLKGLDLHEAILSGSTKHVRRAIKKITVGKNANPAMINQYDELGRTPLSMAVKILNIEMIDMLLDHDALPDIVDEDTGRTPLFFSVLQRAHIISQTLISYKATIDMSDFHCVTPLMLAASLGDLHHLKMFVDRNADVDARDENGWTPLHYAANANSKQCLYYLMKEGANRHLRDMKNRRALDIARFRNHGECIALLEASRLQW